MKEISFDISGSTDNNQSVSFQQKFLQTLTIKIFKRNITLKFVGNTFPFTQKIYLTLQKTFRYLRNKFTLRQRKDNALFWQQEYLFTGDNIGVLIPESIKNIKLFASFKWKIKLWMTDKC